MTISYAITACNEHVELERLLDQINGFISMEDEIVLQLDSKATPEVKAVAEKYNVGTVYEYHRIIYSLDQNFAAFKNNLKDHCSKDFIFFIDADELLHENLAKYIKQLLYDNYTVDCFYVPRINTVEGLTDEDIKKWGWRVDENNWINFPDYQTRICKNAKEIHWRGSVHEQLHGWKTYALLPLDPPEYTLLHPKTIDRQRKQNQFYDTINPFNAI